ncbi:MAG: hypothetical protein AAF514_03215 [Verrucomicrobiota bacterium]
MKNSLPFLVLLMALTINAVAHERITVGPSGGRIMMLDSPTAPNAEFTVKENQARIALLDAAMKPIKLEAQTLQIIAGKRADPTRLKATVEDNHFVAGPLPEGEDYMIIFRLKESGEAKALTFRLHYETVTCGECDRVEWLCTCGNAGSGKDVVVPADLKGLWAEMNQHHEELKAGYKDKSYEALDEVTDAFPVLAAALPGKSTSLSAGDLKGVNASVGFMTGALTEIKQVNASRRLDQGKASLKMVAESIANLKKFYPAAVANAKLKD